MSFEFALCLVTLLVLAGIGMPVAYAMLVAGIAYLAVAGQDLALAGEQILQSLYDSFVLLAVPLFIVAANLMNAGTISDKLMEFCKAAVGRLPGGLAQVDILVSLIFSGMSGSAVADAAGVGKVSINMMVKSGHYTPGFAAAVVAASATIGPIIPPSIPLVLYALISDTSIGYLFIGGILPGLLVTAALMVLVAIIAKRRGMGIDDAPPLSELPRRTIDAFPVLVMPAILLWGIYGGVTTPTEAAALAAAYALVLSVLFYRALSPRALYRVFADSAVTSASTGLVIGAALIFNYIVASERIPDAIQGALVGLDITPIAFLLAYNLFLLVLGCFLDTATIILVIIPLFIPLCEALGIDLVHFGVVSVVNCMIGLITPPYGILLFVINATTGIPLRAIIGEIWAFIAMLLVSLLLMILFPEIVLFLPRLMGYGG